MLKGTVQAIQGQGGAAGQPKAAITARFGKPAPMTRQATAAFESRRDFTHTFQVACRNALAIIATKTVRDKTGATPGRSSQSMFRRGAKARRRRPRCGAAGLELALGKAPPGCYLPGPFP